MYQKLFKENEKFIPSLYNKDAYHTVTSETTSNMIITNKFGSVLKHLLCAGLY